MPLSTKKQTNDLFGGSAQLSSTFSGCNTRRTYLTLTQPVTTCDRREDDDEDDEDGDDEDVEDEDDDDDDGG